jgi:GT2 family glycosyltransferase
MSGIKLSVVIVSYNVKDFVLSAIKSVLNYVDIDKEIIVVDNASKDDTVEALFHSFPEVIVISNTSNAGFSEANNQGFAIAKGEFILMLNPDAELLDAEINNAIKLISASTKPTIVGPRILNPDLSLQVSAWKFQNAYAHLLEAFFINKVYYPFNYNLDYISQANRLDSLSGACLLAKREVLINLGGLDNNLFWMDDVDLCYRIAKIDGECIYLPTWKVKHFIGESSKKNRNIVIANQIISKLKFYKKHKQTGNFVLSVFILQLHILIRLLILLLPALVNKSSFIKLKAYVYTQRRFFQHLFLNKQSVS